jgi:arylformamidase
MNTSAANPLSRWAFLSQVERNNAYNNSAAVAGSSELIQARNQASGAYRSAHSDALDLPYGPSSRQAWDLYPGTDPSAPCLVFFHGGYWQMNSREDFACVAEGLANHGWSVALPGFSIAPEARLEQIVADVTAALDSLPSHVAQYKLGSKIVVSGWSAGAHLAALALAHPSVAAGLSIAGVYDLAPIRDTYLNEKLVLRDEEIKSLSPTRLQVVNKPLTIAYGTGELPLLIEEARSFHRIRSDAHAPGALLPVPHANHYTILDELRSPNGMLTRAALDLVRS